MKRLIFVFVTLISLSIKAQTVQSIVKDGNTIQYSTYHGITISMTLYSERQYGKYYVAQISIENLTGKPFTFYTESIKAIYYKKEKTEFATILPYNDYMRIVNRRQAWNAAINTYNENSAARGAGYSYNNSNSRISAYNQTATINSNSTTYNGASAYVAQQNAQNNINNFQNQQEQIKNVINQGYLKDNTIENNQQIVGYINIKFQKSDKIAINIPINGETFLFYWNTGQ